MRRTLLCIPSCKFSLRHSAVDAGQQGTSPAADPPPAETPSPSSTGSTLPTAPLASLPINFGSSPNNHNETVGNPALAGASPAANATGTGMQTTLASRAADGEASGPGPAVSPAANMTKPATVLNTPLSDLPVSFNPDASPDGR